MKKLMLLIAAVAALGLGAAERNHTFAARQVRVGLDAWKGAKVAFLIEAKLNALPL